MQMYLAFLCFIFATPYVDAVHLRTLIKNVIPVGLDGKIKIPSSIKHIKLDIGLSYNAPMSQVWLTREKDLLVFGFEPNPDSVASILNGASKRSEDHGAPLERRFIGENFFLIPCALGQSKNATVPFFITKNDCGCSSMYTPQSFEIDHVVDVPIFSLANFFEFFPFDTHPVIEYIKIDAQGADLDIAKSAGSYLAERVVYITLEAENAEYAETKNSVQEIEDYMKTIGFIRHKSAHTSDPTYFNPRYAHYIKTHKVQIYQQG